MAPTVTDLHSTEALAEVIEQNEAELASEPSVSLQDLRVLAAVTQAALERVKPLLLARERAGLVRRCHGDLHLGNIVLIDGKPVLFDAIEFNDRIATGDVLYDLAFLLMDLIERGLHQAANIVLHLQHCRCSCRYARQFAPRSLRHGLVQAGSQAELTHRPRDYAALAQKLLVPAKPRLIAIGGLSGTGSRCSRARWRPPLSIAGRSGASKRCRAQGTVCCS